MTALSSADAAAVLRIAKIAGIDTTDLQAINPYDHRVAKTPRGQYLIDALMQLQPELAARLRQSAGAAPAPSLELAAALRAQMQAEALGLEPERLSPALQAEFDSIYVVEAAKRREQAQQGLLQRWEAEATAMANETSSAAFQAQMEAARIESYRRMQAERLMATQLGQEVAL